MRRSGRRREVHFHEGAFYAPGANYATEQQMRSMLMESATHTVRASLSALSTQQISVAVGQEPGAIQEPALNTEQQRRKIGAGRERCESDG